MVPDTGAGDSARGESLATAAPRRGKARARPHVEAGGDAGPPVARIMQLVAAVKAEQTSLSPVATAGDPAERVKLMGWLRRILEAREQERQAWDGQIRLLEAQCAEAQAAAEAALQAAERTGAQHQRVVADLKLMHEHQRSIWQLERRRFEITIGGLEQARRKTMLGRARHLVRPALAAGLLLVSLAAVALSADSTAKVGRSLLDLNHTGQATIIVLGGERAIPFQP
ncbi:MAG: hypothetical protein ACLQJR_17650 [Stellaceae bacterium]